MGFLLLPTAAVIPAAFKVWWAAGWTRTYFVITSAAAVRAQAHWLIKGATTSTFFPWCTAYIISLTIRVVAEPQEALLVADRTYLITLLLNLLTCFLTGHLFHGFSSLLLHSGVFLVFLMTRNRLTFRWNK